MAVDFLKGQAVIITAFNGNKIAASKSCTITYTRNTEDASTKDDESNGFETPAPTTLSWSITNESFIQDGLYASLAMGLAESWANGEKVLVTASDSNGIITLNGYAVITALNITGKMGERATMNLTLEGTGSDLL